MARSNGPRMLLPARPMASPWRRANRPACVTASLWPGPPMAWW
jgi:hypothetical protein